jgi:hypothetical protein
LAEKGSKSSGDILFVPGRKALEIGLTYRDIRRDLRRNLRYDFFCDFCCDVLKFGLLH